MKFYSDMTKKLYDTEEALVTAEKELAAEEARKEEEARKAKEAEAEKKAARAAREDEIKSAYNAMVKAQKAYEKLVEDYVKDYKSYSFSSSDVDDSVSIPTLFNLFFGSKR